MAMSTMQSLKYAQGRLAVARAMCDHPEIEKWKEHVEYWQSKLAAEEADRVNKEICKTCNGIKYIPAMKSMPDKQCPECKGSGFAPRALDVCPRCEGAYELAGATSLQWQELAERFQRAKGSRHSYCAEYCRVRAGRVQ